LKNLLACRYSPDCGTDRYRNCPMERLIPFQQSARATGARKNCTLLFPLPRASAGKLASRVHIALDAMRRG
jgi:hypothetical protein